LYLLDTMVVSEGARQHSSPVVRAWLNNLDPEAQFISVLSLGEIEFGIARLPPTANKRRLETWCTALAPFFAGRILAVDKAVTACWGQRRARARRCLSVVDALIAATALAHGLAVATRNERDFADLGVRVINPWSP
jgi:predicted nucleic acid-binding protein